MPSYHVLVGNHTDGIGSFLDHRVHHDKFHFKVRSGYNVCQHRYHTHLHPTKLKDM